MSEQAPESEKNADFDQETEHTSQPDGKSVEQLEASEVERHGILADRIHRSTVIAAMQGRARRGVIGGTYTTRWFPNGDSDEPTDLRFQVKNNLDTRKPPRQVSIHTRPRGQKGRALAVYDGADRLFHVGATGEVITGESDLFHELDKAVALGENEFDVENMEKMIAEIRQKNQARGSARKGILERLGDDPF